MQLILKEDVHNLGKSGELVHVRTGYGRNYLIPQGFAVLATPGNVKEIEHQIKLISAKNAKLVKDAQATSDKLSSTEVQIARQTSQGEGEHKLFGSVTGRDIGEALAALGHAIDHRKVVLVEPIRALGQYEVEIKVARDVTAKVKVWVVAKSGA